jgi:hypothetical protein
MFNQILESVSGQLADVLKTQHGLGQDEANRAAEATGRSFADLVKQQVNQKDFSTVQEAFSGNTTEPTNPALQSLTEPLTARLSQQLGMDSGKAGGIVATLLPVLFNMFNGHVQTAKGSGIDVQSIIKQFAGGGGFDMSSMGALMEMGKGFMKGKSGGMFSN